MVATAAPVSVGHMLRDWRVRRRMSQLELATAAGISSRHLSFVETGRARPSREMVLHLAEYLDIPLRERNPLLIAAGYAPSYQATDLAAPEMQAVRAAIDRLLDGHEPYPAILIDRRWELVASNAAAMILVEGVAPELLEPPINVLRATLHPEGLAPRIANLGQWIDHILGSLRRQVAITGDDDLRALEDELAGYAEEMGVSADAAREAPGEVAIPMRLRTPSGELAFITMIATFGTALDITLSELSIETFLPADTATAELLHERAHPGSGHKLS
ncbi:MAG TPA: helix-turn-helix transcriptional regulator [Acidimicrobiia bacterium]|jgi:transcriptional regulator with XRE-family HTH domain|nr:helix-turn-helix transcriptional regulator [Acidimicrobiia bacterium]